MRAINAALCAGKPRRDAARSAVIDLLFGRLKGSRISLWRSEGEPGAMRLLCLASKVAGQGVVSTASHLRQAEYAACDDGLVNTGVWVSADAPNAPARQPVRANDVVAL